MTTYGLSCNLRHMSKETTQATETHIALYSRYSRQPITKGPITMSTATRIMSAEVIAGTRPTGSCPPDGSYRWATRERRDNELVFTVYNGWLIESETRTTDSDMAQVIADAIDQFVQ